MAIKIIGAGWGRTGTESLAIALEQLGYGKCYHMFSLINNGKKVVHWEQLVRGEKPNYNDLFNGYQSVVSSLSACFYKEFLKQYPDAKIILTIRDADEWYQSVSKTSLKIPPHTTYHLSRFLGLFSRRFSYLARTIKCTEAILYDGLFKGRSDDKEMMKTLFNQWNKEVIRSIPTDKLLVYEIKNGWKPLCEFLGVPVPDLPFPKLNDRRIFRKKLLFNFLNRSILLS